MNNKWESISLQHVTRLFSVYLLLSIVCCIMVFMRRAEVGYLAYGYLIWNLFLAWIPFVLSILILVLSNKIRATFVKKLTIIGVGGVWLFFYPNAPYLITDYIHLVTVKFYDFIGGAFAGYNQDLLVWFDFVMISSFIFIGVILGYLSLNVLQRLLTQHYGRIIGWCFVSIVLFLSSFGIYLGRFIRWNTWDIITNPTLLLSSVLESIQGPALPFTLLFSCFLLFLYVALHQLTTLPAGKRK